MIEFIASHLDDFLCRRGALKVLPFSMHDEIAGHESLRLESKDGLHNPISEGTETDQGMLTLLGFVRLEYLSTSGINYFSTYFRTIFTKLAHDSPK
jgi:hypothetical protein